MPNSFCDVAVVMLVKNRFDELRKCLISVETSFLDLLSKHEGTRVEGIIVDDHSDQDISGVT
jgi:hypothetical protein